MARGGRAPKKTLSDHAVTYANELDERLGLARALQATMNKIFPDHWSFMLGEIALYSFIVLIATGVFLTLYFVPSTNIVTYHGSYAPLQGQRVSAAYASTVGLSFDVRFGLIMRQMHHWAADVFAAAIVIHMCRIFFTGAFRRPRELNWAIGVTLLTLAIANGFIGYSLPDDLISGTGIRIAFSIVLSIPIVGSYLAFFLFGGNFPGDAIIPRFFILHVLILPAIIAVLIGAHLFLLVHHKHTQFPGKGRTERNVVGSPLWPNFAMKTGGFFFMTTAALAFLGGVFQINPIWLYGSYVPYKVSYAVQPDWYMGWLDGALRIFPSWETAALGHTIPWMVFLPAVVLPGLTFGLLYAWPTIEAKLSGDRVEHHILDRPRDKPRRTAIGAGVLAFYILLFGASSTDVLANTFHISLNIVLWTFRIVVVVIPPIVAGATYWMCKGMTGVQGVGRRKRPNIVYRDASGRYTTVQAEIRPGDEELELEPEELPEERTPEQVAASASRRPAPIGAGMGRSGSPRGVFQVPRRGRR